MARVYLAHDIRHDRKVALKVLRPELQERRGARYHAREVVRVRAKLEGARFVFGSATPSQTLAQFGGGSPAVQPPLLGPASCPLTRIKARWRWHVLVKGPVEEIGRVVRYVAPRLEGRGTARVVLDRDPVSLL